MDGSSNKPVTVLRCGPLSASVFRSRSQDNGTFHKVSLQRTYADTNGELKSTTSFGRDDLAPAALLLQRAWAYVCDADAKQKSSRTGSSGGPP